MKIEIWSDFVCPFCYIGKRHLELGLKQFAHKENVEVIFRSFELDPNMPKDTDKDIYEILAGKYSIPTMQAQLLTNQVTQQAAEVGLTYHFATNIPTNSFDAHRLVHFAKQSGKMDELVERIFKAHFTDSLHVGDHETLTDLAEEVGLDRQTTLDFLSGESHSEDVRQDEANAAKLGIRAVPYFVFNNKYALSGAQPSEVFLDTLQKIWEEEK